MIFACVSGVVMWWKRRPVGQLGVPPIRATIGLALGVAVIALVVGLAFPLGGLAISFFAIIDFLLPGRLKEAGVSNY